MGEDATTQAGPHLLDWRYEVQNGDTILGYTEWLAHKAEAGRPQVIEFTIGVCVRMKWSGTAYVLDGLPSLTDGGLFSDASQGPFDPELGEWLNLTNDDLFDASSRAHRIVESSLALRGVPE